MSAPRLPHLPRVLTTAAAAVLATTACSSAEPEGAGPPGPPAAEVGATLLATVGLEDDPEAYEIALTTEDGEPVESLTAGDYTVQFTDYSAIHNFVLFGPGVDEATSVPDVEEVTVDVTFEPGQYGYVCDPHPSMSGNFQVVA